MLYSAELGASCALKVFYRPNCTVTCAPAATCVPAGGDCWRATPLPTASSSRPVSWAASTAPRTVFPTNDGTSIPPCSTSSTTVPVAGSFAAIRERPRPRSAMLGCCWLALAGTGSVWRIAACTTCSVTAGSRGRCACALRLVRSLIGRILVHLRCLQRLAGMVRCSFFQILILHLRLRQQQLMIAAQAADHAAYADIPAPAARCGETPALKLGRPDADPTAESRITATTICGLFTGANPANEPIYFVFE